jgi:hypothetical protein
MWVGLQPDMRVLIQACLVGLELGLQYLLKN